MNSHTHTLTSPIHIMILNSLKNHNIDNREMLRLHILREMIALARPAN